jgi:Tfp pilus assembly protein PilN
VVVGLALPGPKGVKELDLLPPEVVAGRKRKRIERAFVLVGVVAVAAMAGLGVLRFLKVHDAENQVAGLQGQIAGLQTQIPKFSKVQQERAAILGLASISQPLVQNEVYWPGVLNALAAATPKGGTVTSFSGATVPIAVAAPVTKGATTPPPTPPQDVQTASLAIQVSTTIGYPYFRSWYSNVSGSGTLTVNQFGALTQGTPKHVEFSATVGVTAEVRSIRANEFEVPS